MRIVLSPIPIQQLCLRLPVEPAHIVWAVAVLDDAPWPEAALAELIADGLGIEAYRALHCACSDAAHLFVTNCRVKVLLHAPHQPHAPHACHGRRSCLGETW